MSAAPGAPAAASPYTTFRVAREGAIDWVTLDRPDRLNGINRAMSFELQAYFEALKTDESVRVVILRGAGRAFCAGLDLKEESADAKAKRTPASTLRRQRSIAEIVIRMRRAPQPVIALVHGAAAGGGFAFALAADVRIAARNARMNVAMARIGLTGCDIGISYHLTRAVGQSVASELMLTGRFIDADRALRTGLVSEVVREDELEAAGRRLAEDMLLMSPLGLRLTKEGINFAMDSGSLEATIAMEDRQQVLVSTTGDFSEGVAAFLEKRKPSYTGT